MALCFGARLWAARNRGGAHRTRGESCERPLLPSSLAGRLAGGRGRGRVVGGPPRHHRRCRRERLGQADFRRLGRAAALDRSYGRGPGGELRVGQRLDQLRSELGVARTRQLGWPRTLRPSVAGRNVERRNRPLARAVWGSRTGRRTTRGLPATPNRLGRLVACRWLRVRCRWAPRWHAPRDHLRQRPPM